MLWATTGASSREKMRARKHNGAPHHAHLTSTFFLKYEIFHVSVFFTNGLKMVLTQCGPAQCSECESGESFKKIASKRQE